MAVLRRTGVTLLAAIVVLFVASSAAPTDAATISADRFDYPPNSVVTLSGSGWSPGETVQIQIHESDGDPETVLTAVADAGGEIRNDDFSTASNDLGTSFGVTATGETSGRVAYTAFVDNGLTLSPSSFPQTSANVSVQLLGQFGGTFGFFCSPFGFSTGQFFAINHSVTITGPVGGTLPITGTSNTSVGVIVPGSIANVPGTYTVHLDYVSVVRRFCPTFSESQTSVHLTAQLEITAVNQPPVADAGGPYAVEVGQPLALDGSGSSDPNAASGDSIVNYEWDLDGDLLFDDAFGVQPIIASAVLGALGLGPGEHAIALRVTDALGATGADQTTLSIFLNQPVASFTATPNPAACAQSVTFDASASHHGHPDRGIVSYEWDFGDGTSGSGQTVTHAYGSFGTFAARLTVTDDNSPPKTAAVEVLVSVSLGNQPPVADAGGPYTGALGEGLTLDGSGSADLNAACGDSIVSYDWDLNGDGSFEVQGEQPALSAAQIGALGTGTRTITLRVTDEFGATGSDQTTLTVVANTSPSADAGGPYSVSEGGAVTLSGSGSDPDGDPLTFVWDLDYDGVTFGADATGQTPTFSAATLDGPHLRTVALRVCDGRGACTFSSATVNVLNVAPTASLANDGPVDEASPVTVAFSGQNDPSAADTAAGFSYAFDCGSGFGAFGPAASAQCVFDDGPASRMVRARISDKDGGVREYETVVEVRNVAPSASLGNDGPVDEGGAATISFGGQSDPSAADTAAGFSYAFDCGSGFGAFGPAASAQCLFDDGAASRTVRARISDKDGGVREYETVVEVRNIAPAVTPASNQSANEGASVAFELGSFADPGADSPWQVTVTWGDGSTATSFTRSSAGAIPAANHAYDDNGTYTVDVTVTDKDGAFDTASFQVVVKNVAPTATFNAPAAVDEGSAIDLSLTAPSDPSSADTAAGFQYAFDCGSGFGAFGPSANASCATSDNGVRAVGGKIRDKDGGVTAYDASVQVNNVAPSLGPITAPLDPVAVGSQVDVSAPFTDPGTADTHTAVVGWGDGTTSPGTAGSGTASASHTYAAAGVYTVTITVIDDDGGSDQSVFQFVVVYDPSAGFVTGGGWITSPAGAYTPDRTLTGRATFGFVAKYLRGATTPSGNTEFQFRAGNLNFHSRSYDWLVIAGARAQFRGSGTINGEGDYAFFLTAIDGQVNGGGGADKFRIRIWDRATGGVVYDNQAGAADGATPTTVLGGGSITIHS